MDFTLTTYKKLLNSLQSQGFSFLTFVQYTELKAKAESENSPSQPKTQPQPFSNLKSQPLNTEPRTPNP
ncbi:MAG: hypothetical protein RBT49_03835, partial [Bacteroidales bacterium]|nr:hypothetical protein [Bacteroidales bacterium]